MGTSNLKLNMTTELFDFVIPLYKMRWNTQAVIEGLTFHYQPRAIHVIAPAAEAIAIQQISSKWKTAPIFTHQEETFFPNELTKDKICAELDLAQSLYTPGWFYQQLLKLGAFEGIEGLSEWYMVWDSDLLPVATWQLMQQKKHTFALLQDQGWGNPDIVSKWEKWVNSILKVSAIKDLRGTFIPHHMWLKQEHLQSFTQQLNSYYDSKDHWLLLMMRSANDFGTYSEYWSYVSWVAAQAPDDLSFYPYEKYGITSERFFDDGTGLFSITMRRYQGLEPDLETNNAFSPSYQEIESFIKSEYDSDSLPSALSFESSPRHLKKDEENMHIEELRSRWNPRKIEPAKSV